MKRLEMQMATHLVVSVVSSQSAGDPPLPTPAPAPDRPKGGGRSERYAAPAASRFPQRLSKHASLHAPSTRPGATYQIGRARAGGEGHARDAFGTKHVFVVADALSFASGREGTRGRKEVREEWSKGVTSRPLKRDISPPPPSTLGDPHSVPRGRPTKHLTRDWARGGERSEAPSQSRGCAHPHPHLISPRI